MQDLLLIWLCNYVRLLYTNIYQNKLHVKLFGLKVVQKAFVRQRTWRVMTLLQKVGRKRKVRNFAQWQPLFYSIYRSQSNL